MATAVLCAAVILLSAGLSSGTSIDTVVRNIVKRQALETGDCSVPQYQDIVRPLDPNCDANRARFAELSAEIAESPRRPTPEQAQELQRVVNGSCSDRCALVGYRLGQECFRGSVPQDAIAGCSSNSMYRCGLTPVMARDQMLVGEIQQCLYRAENPEQCPFGCNASLARAIRSLGCCSYSYLQVLVLADERFANSSVEGLYRACELTPPRPCPDPFADDVSPSKCDFHFICTIILKEGWFIVNCFCYYRVSNA